MYGRCIDRDLNVRRDFIGEENEKKLDVRLQFDTSIRKGTIVWHFSSNRYFLAELSRRENGDKQRRRSAVGSDLWRKIVDRHVNLIARLQRDEQFWKSNEVRGTIGSARKTDDELRAMNKRDDPKNVLWKRKFREETLQNFIRNKLKNIEEFDELCRKTSL